MFSDVFPSFFQGFLMFSDVFPSFFQGFLRFSGGFGVTSGSVEQWVSKHSSG